jgi:hypothetical protein
MIRYCKHILSVSMVWLASAAPSLAHPIPDIPVVATIEGSGTTTIVVDVDPRCFEADPEAVPYITKGQLDGMGKEAKDKLLGNAREFLEGNIQFSFEPGKWFLPEFEYSFDSRLGVGFEDPEAEATIKATWSSNLTPKTDIYRVRALDTADYVVLCKTAVEGLPRMDVQALFPSEESSEVDLTGIRPNSLWMTVANFFRQGFVHVLPLGLDHILFVLGIFLMAREWKPLLLQVSAFTAAHTLTLGLATLGWVQVPSKPVEVIIAGSICVIALQNVFRPAYSHRRLWIIFSLGLVHGLGFAGALKELELDIESLMAGLIGFNIGVEAGQLAVLTVAWVLTLPFVVPEDYRRMVVIPVSLGISAAGGYWVFERIAG